MDIMSFLIKVFFRENGKRIRFMDMESIRPQMIESIQDIGKTMKCMDREFLPGVMGEYIKENFKIIKNMGKEYILIPMVNIMMGCGKMDFRMVLGSLLLQKENQDQVNGKMERD